MSEKRMWMVRAGGRGNPLFDTFISEGNVAIGWGIGDLSNMRDIQTIRTEYLKEYKDDKSQSVSMNCGQLYRFAHEFNIGDYVVTYNSEECIYRIGQIESNYYYDDKAPSEYYHIRKVKWSGTISRDSLPAVAKNSLGSLATILEISEPTYSIIVLLLSNKADNLPETPELDTQADTGLDTIKKEFVERAHEFIKDKVLLLSWDEMRELVASILRAMGYKTRILLRHLD